MQGAQVADEGVVGQLMRAIFRHLRLVLERMGPRRTFPPMAPPVLKFACNVWSLGPHVGRCPLCGVAVHAVVVPSLVQEVRLEETHARAGGKYEVKYLTGVLRIGVRGIGWECDVTRA